MSDLRTAAQQALEALQEYQAKGAPFWACDGAVSALRAALAEPQVWVCPEATNIRYPTPGHCEDCGKTLVQVEEPVQEPVAWRVGGHLYGHYDAIPSRCLPPMQQPQPLYTAPQRKSLTCDQIYKLADQVLPNEKTFHQGDPKDLGYLFSGHELEEFARRIERAQGITE